MEVPDRAEHAPVRRAAARSRSRLSNPLPRRRRIGTRSRFGAAGRRSARARPQREAWQACRTNGDGSREGVLPKEAGAPPAKPAPSDTHGPQRNRPPGKAANPAPRPAAPPRPRPCRPRGLRLPLVMLSSRSLTFRGGRSPAVAWACRREAAAALVEPGRPAQPRRKRRPRLLTRPDPLRSRRVRTPRPGPEEGARSSSTSTLIEQAWTGH